MHNGSTSLTWRWVWRQPDWRIDPYHHFSPNNNTSASTTALISLNNLWQHYSFTIITHHQRQTTHEHSNNDNDRSGTTTTNTLHDNKNNKTKTTIRRAVTCDDTLRGDLGMGQSSSNKGQDVWNWKALYPLSSFVSLNHSGESLNHNHQIEVIAGNVPELSYSPC